jgi:hypothetical protein
MALRKSLSRNTSMFGTSLRRRAYVMALIASLATAHNASAALSIHVGTRVLAPNTANQKVQLFVVGGDAVQAVDCNVQIADGGLALGGVIDGPKLSDLDILTGTIFSGNNTGAQNPGSFPQLAIRNTTTSGGNALASGLLATVTIDTTGFFSGTYALNLKNTLNGPTDFATVPVTITDGFIVVPEPALSYLGWVGLLTLRRRRRR